MFLNRYNYCIQVDRWRQLISTVFLECGVSQTRYLRGCGVARIVMSRPAVPYGWPGFDFCPGTTM
jgi:hypothetical protein